MQVWDTGPAPRQGEWLQRNRNELRLNRRKLAFPIFFHINKFIRKRKIKMAQVINIEKYKDNTKISSVAKHNLRCYIPKNVDPERQKDNIFFVGTQGKNEVLEDLKLSLKDVKHRVDANKVVNLVFGASKEEFEKMGEENVKKWASEMHNHCAKKFGKDNILYSVLHRDETAEHLHFAFIPLRDGKLQSNYWFDGPAKLQAFRKEIYAINKKYGISADKPKPKDKKVERKKIDEFYAKVKRSERLDNQIEAEIEAVKDIGFTLNPKAKIKELTPKIQHIAEYAHTASTRIKAYKDKLDIEKTKTKTKTDEVKKLNDDLRRFEEVDNLKHLSYMELMQLNTYVENKYQIEDRKEKEKNGNKYLPTPKPEHSVQSSSEKTVDRKIKPR